MTFEEHRREAALEDARFLLDRGCSIEEVSRRVGMPVSTLQTYLNNRYPQR